MTNSLLCNFHPNTTANELDSTLSHWAVTIEKTLFDDPFYLHLALTENAELDVLSTANRLHESGLVRWAKADMVLPLEFHSIPNDPLWGEQWYFRNTGQTGGSTDADIDLDEARDYFLPTTPIVAALMDDGVEGHPDFPAGRLEDGWDYFYNNSDEAPHGDGYHGMSVLGIIVASESNGAGICGMTRYNVRILGLKIVDEYWAPDPTHFASDGLLARAFSDAVQKGAGVINVSWGCVNCGAVYPQSTSWIRKADSAGVLVVVSSGNTAPLPLSWPANTPEVLTVGASDSTDTRWSYSQYGAELDIVAPSGNRLTYGAGQWQDVGRMWSLDRVGGYGIDRPYMPWNCLPSDFDYNCVFGGTSAAAAQTTGVAILLML